MRKRFLCTLLCLVLCAVTLSACGMPNKDLDHVVVADTQCPSNLDLAESWNSWFTSRWGITETLFSLDAKLNPQPCLATGIKNIDRLTWEVTLRPGVRFQNGKSMTAQAVIRCWRRTAEKNPRFQELVGLKDVQADGNRLILKTSRPVPTMENQLCDPLTGIMDVDSGTDMGKEPVGTGPYIPISYQANTRAEEKRFDGYWRGRPKFRLVTVNVLADSTTLAMAQQNQETDLSMYVPAANLSLFQDKNKFIIDEAVGSRAEIVYFNFQRPVLQQKAVRQALSMCIDKKNYAKVINQGGSVPASGLYPDRLPYGDVKGYSYNPAEAKRLLDRAGIVDHDGDGIREYQGKPVTLELMTYNTRPELPNFANEMSDSARKLGLKLNVSVLEDLTEQEENGDFDLLLMSFTMVPTGDPQYFADIAFHTGGSSNYGKYSNPEVDALIDRLDLTFDPQERISLTWQFSRKILDDAAFVVIGHSNFICVRNTNVKGFTVNPSEYYTLSGSMYKV